MVSSLANGHISLHPLIHTVNKWEEVQYQSFLAVSVHLKNDIISSVRKHYCALGGGLVLGLELR